MHGLPPHWFGLVVMRFMATPYRVAAPFASANSKHRLAVQGLVSSKGMIHPRLRAKISFVTKTSSPSISEHATRVSS
jgi:hypothetical protein